MPLELLSEWDQLSEADRVTILAALVEIVDTRLREETWYPNTPGATPSVEVYGAHQDELRLTVQFLGHYLMYCFAQSGSDWAYHYVFTGEAVFVGARCVTNTVVLVVEKFLSERDVDSYDRAATVAEVRDAAIATLRAPTPLLGPYRSRRSATQ
ncbi:MAG: hypothetical protein IPQ07_10835 [Myxococcales bacterium]|nr:hypothetical protein [Myxococcales bacterium]